MRPAAALFAISGLVIWGCSSAPTLQPPTGQPSTPPATLVDSPAGTSATSQPAAPYQVVRITPQQVKARMDQGESILIADVRGPASYNLTHIAGAVSLPAADYQQWAPTLDREQTIVFY